MARLKSRPLQRTAKRKSQDRVLRESSRSSSTKRLRLQSPSEREPPPTKRGKKKKGKSLLKKPEDAHLPPELRRAGLMAHMHIPKGKCFGPFNGRIVNKEKSPDKMHFFVSEVGDNKRKSHFFYAHKDDKDKCSWLSRLQSATSERKQNIVAYNSSSGVCFEAVKDIKAGEELMALFDKTFKDVAHSVYVENTPAVSYITDETGRQMAIVQLDTEVDKAKVYVDPTSEEGDNERQADEDDDDDDDDDDAFEGEDMEIEDDDDDDDDYKGDDDDDRDDGSGVADKTAGKSGQKRKRQKKKPNIEEVTSIDADSGAGTTKYCCTHCLDEFVEKEQAQEHSASRECLSKQFHCSTCTLEFKNAFLLQKHKCGGKPKCYICDEEFEELAQLQDHQNSPPADHLPKCAQCDVQFQHLTAKASHVRSKHGPPEKQVECRICHKTYKKSYLKEHIASHSSSDARKCSECGKTFSSRSNLTKHRKKHLPGYVPNSKRQREKKYCCHEEGCEKRFDSSKALESHLRCHTGERPFECEQCSWKFTQKTHLTRHIKSVHEKVPRSQHEGRSNVPATCEVCNKVYVNSRVLSVHVQSVHEGLRPYKCEYCDATYTQRGHLWRHKHASHFEKDEVQKKYASDKFSCNFDECEQTFNTKAELVEHVKTHAGSTDKPSMCNECGATFVSQQNLAKHSKRRHTDHGTASHKGHRCEKCDKMFFTSYQLVVHFRCHTGEKPYKCDLCGKDFVQKSGLRKHIRCKRCPMVEGRPNNPRSARKYACEHCDKMFPGPSDLKAHVRTHTGEKPYQCHVCEKGFSQPGNLTKHVRFVHNKEERPKEKEREKKFFCSLCGKAFLCPSSLAMHCRTHSGDKPYTCDKCGQAFAQAGNLKKHFKRWHDEGAEARPRRRKVKGQKSTTEATQDEASDKSQESREPQPEATGEPVPAPTPASAPAPAPAPMPSPVPVPAPSQASISNTTETPSDIQHEKTSQATSGADTPVTSALPSQFIPSSGATLPSSQAAVSDIRQMTCTPLNTPSHLYGTTPLNTAVTSSLNAAVTSSLNVPATQRIPILFGYVTPMDTATVQSSQTSGDPMQRSIPGGPLNLPPMPPQGGNLTSLSAQELQQVVISRILAAENTENPFLPPNVAGMPANLPPRAPVLLPHVHSLLNPPGVNTSAGEVTVWPFSPNSNLFQQQYE